MVSKETEFNSSIASLKRLDYALIKCNQHREDSGVNRTADDLESWKQALYSVWLEVNPKLSRKEHNKIISLFNKIKETGKLYTYNMTENGLEVKLNNQSFNARYTLYMQIEQTLRRMADTHGMLITDKKRISEEMD